jgi:hypothetical protein
MKAKHALLIFVSGYCFNFIGGLLKILHWQQADTVLIIATVLTIFGALLFFYKLTSYPDFKKFLDS